MKRIICILLCLCSCLIPCSLQAAAKEEISTPDVASAILYEATTDTVLYEFNADRRSAPASMTKVMTAILVLEKNPELKGKLTVSKDAVSEEWCWWMDDKHLFAGEVISYEDCMNYLLIPSGNEAATAMAIDIAGSVPAFVKMMNDKAAELGCDSTHFEDPHGLSGAPHQTTPRDMLKICLYAMKFDRFREIVCKKSGQVPASNMREYPFFYQTTNLVMDPGNTAVYRTDFTDEIIGIKTGTTDEAGYCLSACMETGGLSFYSVVMGGKDTLASDGVVRQGNFLDTVTLFTYAHGFVKNGFAAGETVCTATLPVKGEPMVPITAEKDLFVLTEEGQTVEPVFQADKDLKLPIRAGERVGTLSVTDTFGNVHSVGACTKQDLGHPVLLLILIPILFLLLMLTGYLLYRRHAKQRV